MQELLLVLRCMLDHFALDGAEVARGRCSSATTESLVTAFSRLLLLLVGGAQLDFLGGCGNTTLAGGFDLLCLLAVRQSLFISALLLSIVLLSMRSCSAALGGLDAKYPL